jgi:7,8-dihydropterin-6-yl-methyl-4-(beta-D-ribofuranosyl)aminobenzene 5'-phosphate synthase
VSAAGLAAADAVEVTVLVDNVSDILSTVPRGVTSEIPNLLRAGAQELSGECLCCAHWGLSLLITVHSGATKQSLLFDAGPEAYAVERNGNRLGLDFGAVSEMVLSHGHWDHAGGMLAALQLVRQAGGGPVPIHVNPGMFVTRGMQTPKGDVVPFRDIPSPQAIAAAGGRVVNDAGARPLLGGGAYLSGEIPRRIAYEKGLPGHVKREGETWRPDPWILDERFLAVRLKDKGVVVFTSCSHAGLINVLQHARDMFAPEALYGVVGGFHLSGAACEKIIPETVRDLAQFGLQRIVAGHCTGWRAIHALLNAFSEDVVWPSAVGRTYRL